MSRLSCYAASAIAPVRKSFLYFPLLILMVAASASTSRATCGGGGGGGTGGMSGGIGGAPSAGDQPYPVPWKIIKPDDPPLTDGLAVYWFPSSQAELEKSSLRFSRILALYSQQCVTMGIVDFHTPLGKQFVADGEAPVAVLAAPDGSLLGKAENANGFLKVEQVEKLIQNEMKQREDGIELQLREAKEKAKEGHSDAAIPLLRSIYAQKCMFPKKAKEAAKELKKLGVKDLSEVAAPPVFDSSESARIERTMQRGLQAELLGRYQEAERFYAQAHRMDPADAAPLRYLGEVYRHYTGEWPKARRVFEEILAMPADPISRAVALHGLGKMTIHEGEFSKGLDLLESSVRAYPLALAYRNLAVYWNSEGDAAKAGAYVREALALDPKDPYNLVFAAAFLAGEGHGEEALKIARENEGLLPASYNLAAIYAQAGQKDKALALLKRHFFEYERYQAVRAEEMMEARVDAVFAGLRDDPAFVSLTSGADGKLDPSRAMDARRGTAH